VTSTTFIDFTPVECPPWSKEYAYARDSTQILIASFVTANDIPQRISAQSMEEPLYINILSF